MAIRTKNNRKNNTLTTGVFIKFLLIMLISIFFSNTVFSQAAQVTWDLTANANVSSTTGNVSGTIFTPSAGLVPRNGGYNTTYGAQYDNFGGGYCTPTYTAYYEFTVTPSACYNLEITSITFIYRCSWDPRCYQLFYSIAGGPDTQIGGNIDIPVRNTNYNYNSGAISIAVADGETIRFRLYGSGSTASDFGCRNLVVNGTTTIVPSVPLVSIAASPSSTICTGTSVTFTPTPTGGGTTPTYEWFLNGVSQGTGSNYVNSTLNDADQVYCIMTSNSPCASPTTATSNTITMTVLTTPGTPGSITGSSNVQPSTAGLVYSISAVAGATNYVWTVPSATSWTLDSGQGSTSISTTSGLDGENGNITVYAENMCGTSTTTVLSVTVSTVLPHNGCSGCHLTHASPAGALEAVAGNANLCMSCHNPAGTASAKPFNNTMKAVPGVTGTSHRWDMPSVNALYEANITTEPEMLLRLPGDSIICSTCHNQHQTGVQPKFLRVSNAGDNMCKNCHTARDKGAYAVDPVNNRGTHPVGTFYNTADPRFLATPTVPVQIVGTNVECSSCHGMHYFDSGGANAGAGDGNLLRSTNDENLCISCHVYKSPRISLDHEGMTCVDCHFAHNSGTNNILLINDTINTPNGGPKPVVFTGNSNQDNYADGLGTFDGICEVCHTLTDHYTDDGVGVTVDARHHPASQTCTTCHPHEDAFYAQSNCFDCHNAIADKPGVGPVGGRRQIVDGNGDGTGTGGDFKRASHHVFGAIPNVSDCILCHYMGDHKEGQVKLLDPDQGYLNIYTYDPLNKASIEDFCLGCHDVDGVEGDTSPFSDGIVVPVVDSTLWSVSSHKSSVYTCLDCHDNGHGSNKDKLLEPYNYSGDASPDPMNDEEEFCENCHNGTTASDKESEFNLTHSHQVDEVAEMGTNSNLECVSCHNPHQNTAANPVSDPDNWLTLMPINNGLNGTRDFCVRCHDGAPPAGISFPASSYGTGWDKSSYVSSRHDATINVGETNFVGTKDDCLACHQHHAVAGAAETSKTGIYTMIRGKFDKSGNSGSNACNPWDNNINGDYQLCWDCHVKEMIDKNDGTYGVNAFDDRHDKHVDGVETPCILCHDVHSPYDAGEFGHINLTYSSSAKANNDVDLLGQSLTDAFYISGTRGYCYLYCHAYAPMTSGCNDKNHTPKKYDRFPLGYPWSYTWPY